MPEDVLVRDEDPAEGVGGVRRGLDAGGVQGLRLGLVGLSVDPDLRSSCADLLRSSIDARPRTTTSQSFTRSARNARHCERMIR